MDSEEDDEEEDDDEEEEEDEEDDDDDDDINMAESSLLTPGDADLWPAWQHDNVVMELLDYYTEQVSKAHEGSEGRSSLFL
jgi:hypothetical protein